jgi:hypothetical protein
VAVSEAKRLQVHNNDYIDITCNGHSPTGAGNFPLVYNVHVTAVAVGQIQRLYSGVGTFMMPGFISVLLLYLVGGKGSIYALWIGHWLGWAFIAIVLLHRA